MDMDRRRDKLRRRRRGEGEDEGNERRAANILSQYLFRDWTRGSAASAGTSSDASSKRDRRPRTLVRAVARLTIHSPDLPSSPHSLYEFVVPTIHTKGSQTIGHASRSCTRRAAVPSAVRTR